MYKYLFLTLTFFIFFENIAQQKYHGDLKRELRSIIYHDQIYREYISEQTSNKRRNQIELQLNIDKAYLEKNISQIMMKNDLENQKKIKKIIKKHGYPGKSMVGEPENLAAFYVIHHAPSLISKYYDIVSEAGRKKELPYKYVAMMYDRKLVNQHKPQIYGTQLAEKMVTNKKTGQKENFKYVMPILDPKLVNQKRKEAGFRTTIEQYAKEFGIKYKAYTFAEIDKMK